MSLEEYVNQEQDEYIPVLDFVNALYKHARPQVPLKNILEYLGDKHSFLDLELYRKDGCSYALVRSTGLLKHESSTEIIQSIYNGLDQTQIGISYSATEMKPFVGFYFRSSEVSKFYDYVKSKSFKIVPIKSNAPPPPNHIKTVSSFKRSKPITIGGLINTDKHTTVITPNHCQCITMLYDYFTPHQASCLMAGLHPEFDGCNDDLEIAKGVIENGIKSGKLILDDDGQINADNLKIFLYNKSWLLEGFNNQLSSNDSLLTNPITSTKDYEQIMQDLKAAHTTIEQQNKQAIDAQNKITTLESELNKANAALADNLANSVKHSNTDIHNIKKVAIKQFNRSLAMALIDLDYKNELRKGDIVKFIIPYMKELTFVLADEDEKKAGNLNVSYDILYDIHLKSLGFKQGRQSNKDKKKVNIELLFKKQLPVTE